MRDFRLDPEDVEDIASAYEALLARPDIDPARSGLLGTCVGGAFAMMAAASPPNPRPRDLDTGPRPAARAQERSVMIRAD
jgi:dienelactone hydrolase